MNSKPSIRPEIPNLLKLPNKSDDEVFQNSVLRPILKLQHDLLVEIFKNACNDKKVSFEGLSKDQMVEKAISFMKLDKDLKQDFRAVVFGQFTVDEFGFYKKNKKEVNKRILQMARERVVSQL